MGWKRWQFFAGIVLMVGATAASALSLGRVRGTALIGRGLDLSVQGILEAQEAPPEITCFSADLFYGDTRVSPNQISISPDRLPSGEIRIRIRSSSIVDEPVVTLFLRTACGAPVSRRYVLLAETLSEAELGAAQTLSILPATVPPPVSLTLPRSASNPPSADTGADSGARVNTLIPGQSESRASNTARSAERAAQRQVRREARIAAQERSNAQDLPDVPRIAAPRASVVRKADQPKAGSPRLQVDLLDFSSPDLTLRGSFELSSAPSSDENVRRQAQALWRSLNASPEDILRDAKRLEALETQMRSALEQSKRQDQGIAVLSTELQAAKRARYFNPFTAFLGFLVLLALGLSYLLWRRGSGNSQPWWGSSDPSAKEQNEEHLWDHLVDADSPLDLSVRNDTSMLNSGNLRKPVTGAKTPGPSHPEGGSNTGARIGKEAKEQLRFADKSSPVVDFAAVPEKFNVAATKVQPLGSSAGAGRGGSMGRVDSTPPPSLVSPAVKQASPKGGPARSGFGHTDFASSYFGSSRVVTAEELFDIQEQADFFMSLDQPEQAIEVLKNHITDKVETSALAYMDLFDIYHRTGRKQDYEELREEFNRVFNAQVPDFALYGAHSIGLEEFPEVLSNIQMVWGRSQEAFEVIEESIFRQPGKDQRPLDMTAYRELLLLYALAKELARMGAKFSVSPPSNKSAPLLGLPSLNVGGGLMLSVAQEDMLSMDELTEDRTVRMPTALGPAPSAEDSLDFDLTDVGELSEIKLPGASNKS